MLKALFWFVIGMAGTVVFFAVMLFIFGQSNRVVCRHQEPDRASCSVSNVLLGVVPLPAWVIWLLAGLAAMSIIIQAIVFFGPAARALFGARSVAGGTYR